MTLATIWWVVAGGMWCIACLIFTFWPKRCRYCHGTGYNIFYPDHKCVICEGKGQTSL